MRNGQNPELAKAAEQANDVSSLEALSLTKPAEKATAVEHTPAAEEHIDHDFSSSSFSFQVERSTSDRQEPTKRIQTFPKLEQERPRETKALSNNTLKQTTTKATVAQARTVPTGKAGRRGRGMSLLDRYVSFLAKLIKALEKFLMRRFNRGQAQKQHTQEAAAEEMESPNPDLAKKKKLPIRHGPGI